MLEFLGKKLQKSIEKMSAKTTLTEADVLEVTREIKIALLEADVNLLVVKEFVKKIKEKVIGSELIGRLNPSQQVIKIVREELEVVLGGKVNETTITSKPFILMMTGLQGSGKTTTTAKLVKYFLKKKQIEKPLMIAADIYRPAAVEQLITLGKELQIDVFTKGTSLPAQEIVSEGLKFAEENGHDFIIIDTAGRLSINEELMQELVDIKKIARPREIFFVADALSGQDIINVATEFHKRLNLTGSIITKLDSEARGGAALSLRQILNLPIKFIGTGEKVGNLDLFYPDRMAQRILGMGDVLSLIEKAEEVIDEKKGRRLISRMSSGHFDLNDLLDQFSQINKMGSLSKVLKMIPGIGNKLNSEKLEGAEKKLWLYQILISSMTNEERKNPKLLKNATRKSRVLRGSGRSAQEFNQLINDFENMSKQMRGIAKSVKDGTFNPGMLGGLGR